MQLTFLEFLTEALKFKYISPSLKPKDSLPDSLSGYKVSSPHKNPINDFIKYILFL